MNYTLDELKKRMDRHGNIYLSGTQITALPDNLTVGGNLDLRNTPITALPENLTVGGRLDLRNTPITALPENLTVGGSLDLSGTQITALPDNLTVGGSLDLRNTPITALPENLTVGGWLDLRNTPITALPENLTVGGSLDLSHTHITALPENLTVGGSLYLSHTPIFKIRNTLKYRKPKEAEYVPGKYLYVDEILTHIKRKKTVGKYTYYIGKIQNKNVIFDGERYAHCKDFQSGVRDLEFKAEKDRGAEQYKNLDLSSTVTYEKAIMMYRIITGACQAGTEHFLAGLKEIKPEYTIAEIIKLTKGNYGARTFEEFFAKKGERA